MITITHKYDQALRLVLAPPSGDSFMTAFAAWFDERASGREYYADMQFVKACAVEPKGDAFDALVLQWSGLPMAAWPHCVEMAAVGDPELLDPTALLDGSDASNAHLAALAASGIGLRPNGHEGPVTSDMARSAIEAWLRMYPRRGPAGRGQVVVVKFAFGYVVARAPEPQEWFAVEDQRRKRQHYAVAMSFVKACTLAPSVPTLLSYAKDKPGLVTVLGQIVREAAGEDLAQRVGESFGA